MRRSCHLLSDQRDARSNFDPIQDDADSLSLGERVARARKRLGMTQKELARQLRVDPGTLALWEYGRRLPMPENRAKLEKFITTV